MSRTHCTSPARLSFGTPNAFKLGLFGANMSCGTALTTIEERWRGDWADNVRIARIADEAGLDFLLPVARWKGYGGATDPAGTSLETVSWATAVLAKTQRIHVFATVHAPFLHPVFAAKQFATADQVGEGRFGLNIVVGWNDDEFEMFDIRMPPAQRYPYAREWIECVRRIWAGESFDFEGQFLKLRGLRGNPGPARGEQPMVINAGMSGEGQAFAIECCDGLFSNPPRDQPERFAEVIASAKARAAGRGVPYPVFTSSTVVCRPTQREAEEFYRYCEENADWEAVDEMLAIRQRAGRIVPEGDKAAQRHGMLKINGDIRLAGDPDFIAKRLGEMAAAGADGLAMIFVNQLREVPYFIQEVMPRLERMGLREPVRASVPA